MQASTRVVPVAVCFGVMAAYSPVALVRMRARLARPTCATCGPTRWTTSRSAVRAGLALPEALSQLAIRGPEERRRRSPLREGLPYDGVASTTASTDSRRLTPPVGDRLVESLRIAREVGGSDLGRLLRTLSTFLREDARTRAELETRQGWTVNAARLASAAPWIVLAMLSFQRDSLQAYSTPAGVLVLLIGAAVTVIAYRLMVRIGRLPQEERVLR